MDIADDAGRSGLEEPPDSQPAEGSVGLCLEVAEKRVGVDVLVRESHGGAVTIRFLGRSGGIVGFLPEFHEGVQLTVTGFLRVLIREWTPRVEYLLQLLYQGIASRQGIGVFLGIGQRVIEPSIDGQTEEGALEGNPERSR